MRLQISGARDGVNWPAPGETIDLPESEAVRLCANGSAAPVAAKADVEKAVVVDDVEERDEPPVRRGPGRPRKSAE